MGDFGVDLPSQPLSWNTKTQPFYESRITWKL